MGGINNIEIEEIIKEMTDEELVQKFEWMTRRLTSYCTPNDERYKEKLKNEILNRLSSKT